MPETDSFNEQKGKNTMQLRNSAYCLRLAAFTSVLFIGACALSAPVAPAQAKKTPAQAQAPAPRSRAWWT